MTDQRAVVPATASKLVVQAEQREGARAAAAVWRAGRPDRVVVFFRAEAAQLVPVYADNELFHKLLSAAIDRVREQVSGLERRQTIEGVINNIAATFFWLIGKLDADLSQLEDAQEFVTRLRTLINN